jgi:hypothetical protein
MVPSALPANRGMPVANGSAILQVEQGVPLCRNTIEEQLVRYSYWSDRVAHPLIQASPLFSQLDNPQLFSRIYPATDQGASVAIYELK